MSRFLILDTYYPNFLFSLYSQYPDLTHRSYAEQWRFLMDQCFGTADFYSLNLKQLGQEATEIVANCEPLQKQWSREHGVKLDKHKGWTITRRGRLIPWLQRAQSADWFYRVLTAQVKQYSPDVLYVQDMNSITPGFLREVRPYVRMIVGQIACPIAPNADFSEYDLVLSSLPHYVWQFRKQGLKSDLFRLGFEHTILNKLTELPDRYSVIHVGGYGSLHRERNEMLEALVRRSIPLTCWGYNVNHLSPTSPIRSCYRGEVWGLGMYNVRYNSRIVVSKHVSSVADVYANNMTLYEATGVGTLLSIDHKDNLSTLFETNKEVIAYRTSEECAELIEYYLEHGNERKAIAQAGQERTLREHTYYHRMQELIEILRRYLSSSERTKHVTRVLNR